MGFELKRANLWREPLVHFLIIGVLVFGGHGLWRALQADTDKTIHIDAAQLQRLSAIWAGEAGREPSADDVRALLAEYVREEVLYREAQRLGLARDDTIIRRRLAQKMGFLLEREGPAEPLSEAELRAAFDRDPSVYARPPRLGLVHVPFNFTADDSSREAEMDAVLGELTGAGDVDPAGLGDAFLLSRNHAGLSEVDVGRLFGRDFAAQIFSLEPNRWHGPLRSRLADHLVRIETRDEGGVPAFEAVVAEVRAREEEGRRRALEEAEMSELMDRYTIILDGGPA